MQNIEMHLKWHLRQEKKLNADLNKYKDFVQEVTSKESNETMVLNNKLISEKETGVNIALLLTGALVWQAKEESLREIVKKCIFKANHLMLTQSGMLNENWAILCGIGLTHVEHLI